MTLYAIVLFTHSLLRWLVLVLAVLVLVRSFLAWRRNGAWRAEDNRLHASLVGLVDLQFVIGLVLYAFLSPMSQAFWQDIGAAMKGPILRFYGMEHVVTMLVAIVVLHIGRKRSTRATTDALRHRRVWTSTLAALLLIAIGIPWPGMPYGRPLFRGLW